MSLGYRTWNKFIENNLLLLKFWKKHNKKDEPMKALLFFQTYLSLSYVEQLRKEIHSQGTPLMLSVCLDPLSNKKLLATFLNRAHFLFAPETFLDEKAFNLSVSDGVWLLKTAHDSEGRQINICRNRSQVDRLLLIRKRKNYVIQKRIEDPLLINGCKCDFRVYLYLDSSNKIYVSKNVGIRVARRLYDPESVETGVQLTNMAQGARIFPHTEWSAEVKDIKWSVIFNIITSMINQFLHSVLAKMPSPSSFVQQGKSKQNKKSIISPIKGNEVWFAFLGLDILITKDLKPYLLEVNQKPGLGGMSKEFASCELSENQMMTDLIHHIITPSLKNSFAAPFPVCKQDHSWLALPSVSLWNLFLWASPQ